jgi:hypothetical protein
MPTSDLRLVSPSTVMGGRYHYVFHLATTSCKKSTQARPGPAKNYSHFARQRFISAKGNCAPSPCLSPFRFGTATDDYRLDILLVASGQLGRGMSLSLSVKPGLLARISARDFRSGALSSLTLPGGGSQNHQPPQIGPGPLSFMAASEVCRGDCSPAPIDPESLTAASFVISATKLKTWLRWVRSP